MASPAEIIKRWDRRCAALAAKGERPNGYIRLRRPDGTREDIGVWLKPGETPESMDLKSFRIFPSAEHVNK